MAPPVRPSRSLEGLERVIPPLSLSPKVPFSPRLFLNKPLPARPLPEEPECSAMWSDSSDSESTVDSIVSPSEPRDFEYPIFVGADDFDLVDHPAPSADPLPVPPLRTDIDLDIEIDELEELEDVASIAEDPPLSVSVSSSWSDTQHGRPVHWAQNRPGTSHYFREKKWDYFPELAPSTLQVGGRISPSTHSKRKKNLSALDFTKARYRWHSLDRTGLGGVRESIKTYVHRTLSRDSTETKSKEVARPSTAPMDRHIDEAGSTSILGTSLGSKVHIPHHSSLDDAPFRAISVSTVSTSASAYSTSTKANARVASLSASDYDNPNHHMYYPLHSPLSPVSPTAPNILRQKQLAVPLSPYQKYGSSIWETPKKSKKRGVQFPKYAKSLASPTLEPEAYPYPGLASGSAPNPSQISFANPTPPLSPPLKSQLLQNTRGAVKVLQRKKNESKEEKRRELLKAQIKFVGPVNPHTYGKDPWV
ncbi:hypothetical protein PENANT_c031G11704 [Penicillium antarcticum]|uniref:Uncharacterized protein n=1 Tax=Penicillium antarcticum TaxID=416450 RepID=A0A1V6PV55_9EURO|nr:uncharacterized protein N7508_005517 [Penicillium antarcticum]KAJ5306502.1 hypothetical protein N7508_005517 [Penicillium antarcticum]OQD80841.1 hypothetical protein PENANT_c031G11704 [Penicillium antarcticum]